VNAGDYLTVEEICQRYRVKRGYAYRLASVYGWRRMRCSDRRVRYWHADVDAVLGARIRMGA
jgi:hypothetical protein